MSLTEAARPSVIPQSSSRPVWRSYGGGGLIAGGAILLAATIVEWAYFVTPDAGQGFLAAYLLPFVAALIVLALSTVPLAFGDSGTNGIVGRSTIGRIALLGYGWFFVAAQFAYLFTMFVLDPSVDPGVASTVNLVFTALQTVSAIVAVVVIVRARVATGVARWSLAASVAVGIVVGIASNTVSDLTLIMGGFCLSALSIVFVGVTYVLWRPAARRRTA